MSFKVFCDTNVPIAYVFHIDNLHYESKEVFNEYSEFFWSNNVSFEFDRVYIMKLEYLKSFFHDMQKYLESPLQEFYSIDDLFKFAVNQYDNNELKKIKSSIEPFWREYIGFESKILFFDMKNSMDDCLNDLVWISKLNKDFLKDFIQLTPQRFDNYPDITKLLESLDVHKSDREIILDAHDFASRSGPVDFVTFDHDCYEGAKNVELWCFNSVRGRQDFN